MTQAPIHPRHKDMAANLSRLTLEERFAQTLANDEAKGKALAEIDRIARHIVDDSRGEKIAAIAAPYRASDPQPVTGCPDCDAFKREVSDACKLVDGFLERDGWALQGAAREALSRFIIPASDPVAEAAREAIEAIWQLGTPSRDAVIAAVINLARTIEGDR